MKLNEVAQAVNHQQIKRWLDTHKMFDYVINQDGTVDVDHDVVLPPKTKSIAVQFGTVNGSFNCGRTQITSLVGSPRSVRWGFYCPFTRITNLIGAPHTVEYDFDCANTNLVSLAGAPESIAGDFYCNDTPLADHHVLQLLKQDHIKKVVIDGGNLDKIINRYLAAHNRDILACQDELIDAGFGTEARL